MPDYENMKPGTDLLNESANNIGSDRARRISSLHRTVDDLVQEQNKKRLQVLLSLNQRLKEKDLKFIINLLTKLRIILE